MHTHTGHLLAKWLRLRAITVMDTQASWNELSTQNVFQMLGKLSPTFLASFKVLPPSDADLRWKEGALVFRSAFILIDTVTSFFELSSCHFY